MTLKAAPLVIGQCIQVLELIKSNQPPARNVAAYLL